MLSHRRFSRPVLSTTQPSLRVKKQFSRQTRVLYYHAGGTLSTKRPARNLKKTKNRACKPVKTVVFLVGCLRKLHIRVWRSLVSRLNGVQEASSSNLDTRTKGSAFRDESASFFVAGYWERKAPCTKISGQRPQCRKAHALGVQTGTVIRPSAIESPCPLAGRGALTPLHKGDGFPRQCEHWLEMTRAGRCGTKRDVEDAVPYK